MEALEGKNTTGTDLPQDDVQAFSGNTTEQTIEGWAIVPQRHPRRRCVACSKIGMAAQVLITLVLSAASAFGEVISGGTLTPAIVAIWAAKEGVRFAVSAVAMHFAQQFILNKTTLAKLAKDAFSGPVGGDLLAYGARTAANIGATSSGG